MANITVVYVNYYTPEMISVSHRLMATLTSHRTDSLSGTLALTGHRGHARGIDRSLTDFRAPLVVVASTSTWPQE